MFALIYLYRRIYFNQNVLITTNVVYFSSQVFVYHSKTEREEYRASENSYNPLFRLIAEFMTYILYNIVSRSKYRFAAIISII